MTNEELICSLRYCFEKRKTVVGVPWYVWCDRAADALEAAEKRIEELEAQMPKEGEWKDESIDIWGDKREVYRCSVCENMNAWMSRYCPNCGARMRTGDGLSPF